MQIVLTKDVPNLGQKGEVKTVKPGYFRNFLAPRAKALRVTPKLMKQILEQQKQREQRKEDMLAKAEDFGKKIEKMTITFCQKTTTKGKLYAAITEKNVLTELEKHLKVDLDKNMIQLEDPIKEVGDYRATVKLTDAVSANLKIVVEAEK
jgi:large subunit ribosomal protein L9